MRRLIVIRHLTTLENQEQRFSSGERNVKLLENQIIPEKILRMLRKLALQPYRIAHSGLLRSHQTAQLLADELKFKPKLLTIPQFKERFGGQLAGLRFSELQQRYPKLSEPHDFWEIEDPAAGLESVCTFLARIETGLSMLRSFSPELTIVAAHAGSIKGIRAVLQTTDLNERKMILCEPTPQATDFYQFAF